MKPKLQTILAIDYPPITNVPLSAKDVVHTISTASGQREKRDQPTGLAVVKPKGRCGTKCKQSHDSA
jgi:hypothetical protein